MNIMQSILYIYPTLEFIKDFIVEDKGNWDEISWYTTEFTQPTQAELETAWAELQAIEQENLKKQSIKDLIIERRDLNRFLRDLWFNEIVSPQDTWITTMFQWQADSIQTRITQIDTELLAKEQSVVEDVFNSLFA